MTAFQTTVWTVVERAGLESQGAIETLVRLYRPPVMRFIRSHGFDEHAAEDLSQEVFKRLFVDGVLRKADPGKGRFRGLVLGVTRRVVSEDLRRRNALKRREVPLPPPPRAETFDLMWLEHLLNRATERLREKSMQGRVPYAEAFELHVRHSLPYAEIGARLKCSEGAARNWIHRARAFIAEELRRLVREYSSSPEDFESEVRYLSRFLP